MPFEDVFSMMRISICILPLSLLSLAAFDQSPETTTKFEVADVHTSPYYSFSAARGPFFSTSRYELRDATMVDLIHIAYDLDPEKISGGPSWIEMDRYDIFAKTSAASNAELRRHMLQSLLAERFNLVTHNDSRPMPAWALTAGKHSGLKESDGSGESGCKFEFQNAPTAPPAPGTPIQLPTIVYTCRNTSMATLAAGMLDIPAAAGYFNNRLVVDRTSLEGKYDFSFGFTPKVPAAFKTIGENVTIFDAIERLGLKLEMANVPMPVIVVDSVNRTPTPNSAETMKSFPKLPTEFEVAALKPVDTSTGGGRGP